MLFCRIQIRIFRTALIVIIANRPQSSYTDITTITVLQSNADRRRPPTFFHVWELHKCNIKTNNRT